MRDTIKVRTISGFIYPGRAMLTAGVEYLWMVHGGIENTTSLQCSVKGILPVMKNKEKYFRILS